MNSGSTLEVYCDGACEPVNPGGIATFGWVIFEGENKIAEHSGFVMKGVGSTNNIAEYHAIINALGHLSQRGFSGKVIVYTDSQLAVNQINGSWKIKKPHLQKLVGRVSKLNSKFSNIVFVWIPREQNMLADALSKKAYFACAMKDAKEQLRYSVNK